MLNADNYANINPWLGMLFVIWLMLPLGLFALGVAVGLHFCFGILPPLLPAWLVPARGDRDRTSPSYLLLTAMFGVALGALIKLLGGFDRLIGDAGGDAGTMVAGVVSILLLALGTLGTLLGQDGKLSLQRPLGAVSFLSTVLASAFYFQYLILTA